MSAIAIEGLRKDFIQNGSPLRALADVSIDVSDNQFVSLLGPSGCGKSTLLNILAGFEAPTSGTARVGGEIVRSPHPSRAVVFQDAALFTWLDVWGNITFGPRACGVPRSDYEPRARELIAAVGLTGFEKALPSQLSGGMRQRVGIARALIMQPAVLLMDEPFGALDAQTRLQMQTLLLGVWEKYRSTIVFITHDVDEAIRLSDVVYIMGARPGRIVDRLDVSLPRPRTAEMLTSDDFNGLRQRAYSAVLTQLAEA